MDRDVFLVILGAGASFDCVSLALENNHHVSPEISGLEGGPLDMVRPPLTEALARPTHLYNRVMARYPQCRPVVDAVRRRLAEQGEAPVTLEQALAEYQKREKEDPTTLRHIFSMRFYLRDLLWACTEYMLCAPLAGGITNYTPLVRDLHYWATKTDAHVCFVIFNYDLIAEQSFSDTWNFSHLEWSDYTMYEYASVLKPHGSVCWEWVLGSSGGEASTRAQADQMAINSAESFINGGDRRLEINSVPPYRDGRTPVRVGVPALALPMMGKTELLWPEEQREHLKSLQGRVTRLLTIGWRAAEPHFVELLNPLITTDSKVLIVTGGSRGDSEIDEISSRLPIADRTRRIRGVSTGFRSIPGSEDLQWLLA